MESLRVDMYFNLLNLFIGPLMALSFDAQFWEKENCLNQARPCLPQAVSQLHSIELAEPANNSFSLKEISLPPYRAQFLFTKRDNQGGYYSFQITLFENNRPIALCTRYEALDTFESSPVGACAGVAKSLKLLGISVYKP